MIGGLLAVTVATLLAGPLIADGQHEATVTWTKVSATAGCWFFVGPEDIGRDQRLGVDACVSRRGDDLTISVSGVPFRGKLMSSPVALSRRSTHEHGGSWTVEQHLSLVPARSGAATLSGTYRYTECEPNERTCTGTCQIRADITIALSKRSCGPAVADAGRDRASAAVIVER